MLDCIELQAHSKKRIPHTPRTSQETGQKYEKPFLPVPALIVFAGRWVYHPRWYNSGERFWVLPEISSHYAIIGIVVFS